MTSFKVDAQLAKTGQPPAGARHPQVLTSTLLPALGSTARNGCGKTSSSQMLMVARIVVAFVVRDFLGVLPWSPGQTGHRQYRLEHHIQQRRVVSIVPMAANASETPSGIHRDMTHACPACLCRSGSAQSVISRGLGALATSTLTRLQSISSSSRKRLSNARCTRSHTPYHADRAARTRCHSRQPGPFTLRWRPFCKGRHLENGYKGYPQLAQSMSWHLAPNAHLSLDNYSVLFASLKRDSKC
jgi:hypothetical protein